VGQTQGVSHLARNHFTYLYLQMHTFFGCPLPAKWRQGVSHLERNRLRIED
jgi:hypothetical protein